VNQRFTPTAVRQIRELYAEGAGQKALALRFGCNRKSIQDIVHGRTYKAVGGPRHNSKRVCPTCSQVIVDRGANT
jgi:hypothetical protein